MKKSFTLVLLAIAMFGCSKKITPAKVVAATPAVKTVPAAISAAASPDMLAAGEKLYVAKCGRCHELKEPAHFTKERWVGLMNWMAPKAKATDDEKAQMLAYVQHNAKKG